MLAPAEVPAIVTPRSRASWIAWPNGVPAITVESFELVAAGHEDAGGAVERLDVGRGGGLGAVLRAYAEDLGGTEPGEQGLVDLDDLRAQRAGGRDHGDPGLRAPGAVDELLEDGALAELVLGAADDEEVTDPARRTH